jgi:hypothetical protein
MRQQDSEPPVRKRLSQLRHLWRIPARYHAFGSLCLVLFSAIVISRQISDRSQFADSELHRDVADRWGAPIAQPAPSVRFVPSGSVFTNLQPLTLESQKVTVEAEMNYRKRGLVLFSGFEFKFAGKYSVLNPQRTDIDVAFIFPIDLNKNKVQLAQLTFAVDGKPANINLADSADKLVWTGRLAAGQRVAFDIEYQGRGLDWFVYKLDPALPVRNFQLKLQVRGGDNYDYPDGIVPARNVKVDGDRLLFEWTYPSLESGLSLGAILPSEKPFDDIIATMVRRSWAPFLLMFAGLSLLAAQLKRPLRAYEAYLISAAYGFFFVLLAYLAAFINFYAAYGLSFAILSGLIVFYVGRLIGREAVPVVAGLAAAAMLVPTLAVILRGYTGLIYALEILAALAALMAMTLRRTFRELIEQFFVLNPANET